MHFFWMTIHTMYLYCSGLIISKFMKCCGCLAVNGCGIGVFVLISPMKFSVVSWISHSTGEF